MHASDTETPILVVDPPEGLEGLDPAEDLDALVTRMQAQGVDLDSPEAWDLPIWDMVRLEKTKAIERPFADQVELVEWYLTEAAHNRRLAARHRARGRHFEADWRKARARECLEAAISELKDVHQAKL